MEVYHGLFNIENGVCRFYSSFREASKVIPLYYGLGGKIIFSAFDDIKLFQTH